MRRLKPAAEFDINFKHKLITDCLRIPSPPRCSSAHPFFCCSQNVCIKLAIVNPKSSRNFAVLCSLLMNGTRAVNDVQTINRQPAKIIKSRTHFAPQAATHVIFHFRLELVLSVSWFRLLNTPQSYGQTQNPVCTPA